jgi:hypothetical protein
VSLSAGQDRPASASLVVCFVTSRFPLTFH